MKRRWGLRHIRYWWWAIVRNQCTNWRHHHWQHSSHGQKCLAAIWRGDA